MSLFQIKNRFTGAIQVEVEIGAEFDASPHSIRLGAAVEVEIGAEANLSKANLSEADLSWANLSDFVVPSLNRRILAAIEAGNGFDMRQWHACETTHCRGGWAIHFAGAVGRTLEFCLGSNAAAALIHLASCPALKGKVPNFFASNDGALADIKRLAELEPPLEPAQTEGVTP